MGHSPTESGSNPLVIAMASSAAAFAVDAVVVAAADAFSVFAASSRTSSAALLADFKSLRLQESLPEWSQLLSRKPLRPLGAHRTHPP